MAIKTNEQIWAGVSEEKKWNKIFDLCLDNDTARFFTYM